MRFLLLSFFVLLGCNLSMQSAPTTIPVPTVTPLPSPTPVDPNWEQLDVGLEYRRYVSPEGFIYDAVRIDPNHYTFRAHYRAGAPLRLSEWRDALPSANVIINANFFSFSNTILGLLISDGVVHGSAYRDRGGMFYVQQDGQVGIRSNTQQPYQGEAFSQAIQAFPMLVYNGQAAYNNSRDVSPSRRSIIGIDAQGRIILMVTPVIGHGLYDLSQYLVTTDLNLVHAFNLDGGGSTMMYRAKGRYTVGSLDPVPAVLAVYER